MEYRGELRLSATSDSDFKVSYRQLKTAFEAIPDPRRSSGNYRYELWAMLMAALAALLSGQTGELGTAEWLAAQTPEVKKALGFSQGTTPHQSTFQRLFSRLSLSHLEQALSGFFDPKEAKTITLRGKEAVAIDGKSQRGRLRFTPSPGQAATPIHLLSLLSHQSGMVLAQTAVATTTNEIGTAPTLLKQISWQGRVLTGDAAFCQTEICRQVVKAGGDYFFALKANQPTLLAEAGLLFDLALLPKGLPFDVRQISTIDKGHGRLEIRRLRASSELATLSRWPYLEQVLEVEREWQTAFALAGQTWRKREKEKFYCITSLPQGVADVAELLALKRGHWGIENRLHWIRDVVFEEDQSLIRVGATPQVFAALTNTAISLLRKGRFHKIKARLRFNSANPAAVLDLLELNA